MASQHKVGGEVDAFCTRCRLTLAHTILAMVGTKIARVRCNTCGGDHAFRSAPGTTDKPSTSSRASGGGTSGTRAPRAGRSSEDKVIISFEEQLAGKDIANAPRYSPKDSYRVDQVIQHPTFGLGLVTAVRGNKVDITFKSETKTLVHAAGGAPAEKPVFNPPSAKATGPADKPQAETTEEPASPANNPAEG
jgi:hypothetical protein